MARGCCYSVIDQRGQINCLFNEDAIGYCETMICPLEPRKKGGGGKR